eukprot:scaffold92482_cov41-Prasinocladus_malaysianus.AAC.1
MQGLAVHRASPGEAVGLHRPNTPERPGPGPRLGPPHVSVRPARRPAGVPGARGARVCARGPPAAAAECDAREPPARPQGQA